MSMRSSCCFAKSGSTTARGMVVKRQVPGRTRVLPFVGHGDDVVVDHVEPVAVAEGTARGEGGGRCAPPARCRRQNSSNCLVQSMPARAWRMTLAASVDTEGASEPGRTHRPQPRRVDYGVELPPKGSASRPGAVRVKRSRMTCSPGLDAHLVVGSGLRPRCAGFTASCCPWTTALWMPSFT